uniref:Protease 3 n=1 Tax=Candidatus Kentrum sp. DK TaxID=2126562 RepID=A0A450S6S6_9GAMM|nr:MAG: Secreted Zn-dependent peptidases, insulinase-like [Candidatus Kentron sp. DK]
MKASLLFSRSRWLWALSLILMASSIPAVRAATGIITSPHDTRQYAAFTLPNRLKVLLVSDPKTDKAAAALELLAGSGADPGARPGLAHFTEHMLFLGTEKYPEPDAFQNFIAQHAGGHNAYTGFEQTNYHFQVDKDHLRQALDRFGQFFIAPTFTGAYVDRERSAVDAEFHAKKKEDAWRGQAVMRQIMNPGHRLSRFRVGNLETLSDQPENPIREDLLAFYRRYYSANLMALVILGKEPLPVLEQWARGIFSAVPDFDARAPRITAPLFSADRLPVRVVAKPVKERRELRLSFPVPPLREHYKTKPLYYIAHLLGHEGKGSLLSQLKARGWANGLSAGADDDHRDSARFTVSIDLTEQGLERRDDATALVFQAIRLITSQGVRRWVFQELIDLTRMDFLFQEEVPPEDYASTLANLLHQYPTREVLSGALTVQDYDEALIRKYLAELTPDNVLIQVTDPDAEPDASWSRTPRFEAPYRAEPIAPALLRRWRSEPISAALALPAPNPFIPQDLTVKPVTDSQEKPRSILQTPGLQLWFHQDPDYPMPRANFYFSIRSPVANDTPEHAVRTDLLVEMTKDQLAEFSYPASIAGLEYEIYGHSRGISVRIEGYRDRQERLLAGILDALRNPKFDKERFSIIKEALTRELRNTKKQIPYRRSIAELYDLLIQPRWTPDEMLSALGPVTLADLNAFRSELFRRISLVALSHGNLQASDALAMGERLTRHLLRDAEPVRVPRAGLVRLAPGVSYLRRIAPQHPDNATALYFQGEKRGPQALAEMALLGQILEGPFFNRLRTEQQLGYIVSASDHPLLEVPGLLLLIQSPRADPAILTERMEKFLADYRAVLAAMPAEEFQRHKAALVARILAREENLGARTGRYWREIDQGLETFDSREREATAARAITPARIRAVYGKWLTGARRRHLAIQAWGGKPPEEDEARKEKTAGKPTAGSGEAIVPIRDIQRFKRGLGVFPETTEGSISILPNHAAKR